MKMIFIDSGMGVFPFIKEILIQKKLNHYIFYLDEENFPYGSKSHEEIFLCYKNLINKVKKYNADKIFIACNTLSTFNDNKNIDDILKVNISNNINNSYYVSTYLTASYLKSKGINNVIYFKDLAYLIEQGNIKKIINLIKNYHFPHSIILTCTHYPLIKHLFMRYSKSLVLSFEDKVIEKLENEKELKIDIITNNKNKYAKFFSNININFISHS